MKYLLFLLLPLTLTNCNGQIQKDNTGQIVNVSKVLESNSYPEEIKKMGLEELYNISKWYMYCIHCDTRIIDLKEALLWQAGDSAEHIDPNNPQLDNTTLGMLPLSFDNLVIKGDTVEMHFYFYYKGKKVNEKLVHNLPYWGTVFWGRSDTIRCYSSRSDVAYFMKECKDLSNCNVREVNPLQPEVIDYIKRNKDKIDPWFRKEAIKRGVITE